MILPINVASRRVAAKIEMDPGGRGRARRLRAPPVQGGTHRRPIRPQPPRAGLDCAGVRSLVPKLLVASIVLLALVWVPAASAAPAVTGQFELGTEIETNNKIVAGPDGNVWFTLPGKKVGEITPAGLIQEFELEGIEGPIGIAVGPEKRIWVVSTGKAVSFLPSSPTTTEAEFESAFINAEPNIVLGPEGMFWVASNNAVAKFSPANFSGHRRSPARRRTLSEGHRRRRLPDRHLRQRQNAGHRTRPNRHLHLGRGSEGLRDPRPLAGARRGADRADRLLGRRRGSPSRPA